MGFASNGRLKRKKYFHEGRVIKHLLLDFTVDICFHQLLQLERKLSKCQKVAKTSKFDQKLVK